MDRYRAYAYVETLGVMITFVVKYMTVLTKQFVLVSCWIARTSCLSTNLEARFIKISQRYDTCN